MSRLAPTDGESTTPAGKLGEAELRNVIGYQMAQASITTLAIFEQQVGERLQLRPVEFTILALVNENPGVTGGRLARALAVTAPNITNWLEKLEKRGLIRREASEADRRAALVYATAKGSRTARQAVDLLAVGELEALDGLSSGERMLLVELLHKVAASRPTAR